MSSVHPENESPLIGNPVQQHQLEVWVELNLHTPCSEGLLGHILTMGLRNWLHHALPGEAGEAGEPPANPISCSFECSKRKLAAARPRPRPDGV